jgi:hypothetical protein
MLHNSLFQRDLLRRMNAHPLARGRRDPHRSVELRPGAKAGAGEVLLEGAWSIESARQHPAEQRVVEDAVDFLHRMKVDAAPASGARQVVLFEVGSCECGFRIVVERERLEVHGADAGSLWAGWTHVENEMCLAGSPVLRAGQVVREPAWAVQIAPPSWGANYAVPDLSKEFLDDDTFRSLAHQGADGMFIYGDWLLYARGTRLPQLDHPDAERNIATLRDAARRAGFYGIRLYFVPVSPRLSADHPVFKAHPSTRGARLFHQPDSQSSAIHCLCTSDPDALGVHSDVFSNLFRQVPELGGLILIIGGESYYHCFMRAAGAGIGHTNCPRCEGNVAEDVIAGLLEVTANAVQAQQERAVVSAWPYSAQAFWSSEPHQLRLIDRLPKGVALLSEIDKDQVLQKQTARGVRYQKRIWDYSVEFDGHSDRIVDQALRCAQRQRGLMIKTETAHGIELLHFPYVPCIDRSARRWQSARALRPAGVLQRWGFVGMFDSPAERIAFQARWDPDFTPAGATNDVARQLFGSAATTVVEAWRAFSAAVGHIPILTTGAYYVGPAFLGPCHPLPVWDGPTPEAFRGSLFYLTEVEATFTPPRPRGGDDFVLHDLSALGKDPPIEVIEAEFVQARDLARGGWEMLRAIDVEALSSGARDEVTEQQAMGEYLHRTFFTTVSTIRFLRGRDGKADHGKVLSIARDELQNTEAARGIFERAPWLNHNLRLDVGAPDSLVMIDEKLRLLREFIG